MTFVPNVEGGGLKPLDAAVVLINQALTGETKWLAPVAVVRLGNRTGVYEVSVVDAADLDSLGTQTVQQALQLQALCEQGLDPSVDVCGVLPPGQGMPAATEAP